MSLRRGCLVPLLLAVLAGCAPGPPFFCDWRPCLFLPSCRSPALFTDEYRVRLESRLPRVQFYLSRDLVLRREMETTEEVIDIPSHRIRIERDRRILEIEFPAGTPGVLRDVDGDTLWVVFEDRADGLFRSLPFRRTPIRTAASDMDDPANFVYQFAESRVRYEGAWFEARFVREGVPVTPSDVTVHAPPADRETGVHRIRKTFYPALTIALFEHEAFHRERRRAEGVRVRE